MPSTPVGLGLDGLRDLFKRSDREDISSELQTALSLLKLDGLDELEQRFLAVDAFLKPWAVFRDAVSFFFKNSLHLPTNLKVVTRADITRCYTQYDGDSLRYDPRGDPSNKQYDPTLSNPGTIDKSKWTVEDYERHLYVWLLQDFKIGKSRNPWGLDYFNLKSTTKIWLEIMVPIVNSVRASYSTRGKRHYGRLALFIEARCPSLVAFPADNVKAPESALSSPSPFRVFSRPKKTTPAPDSEENRDTISSSSLSRDDRVDASQELQELRETYPQYGGLVERPKFKMPMREWLAEQQARADRRKASKAADSQSSPESELSPGNTNDKTDKESPSSLTWHIPSRFETHSLTPVKEGALKRYSNSLRRSLSLNSYLKRSNSEGKRKSTNSSQAESTPPRTPQTPRFLSKTPEPRSTFESVPRTPDSTIRPRSRYSEVDQELQAIQEFQKEKFWATPEDDPKVGESSSGVTQTQETSVTSEFPLFSPMGPPSAIPRPLYEEGFVPRKYHAITTNTKQPAPTLTRVPSYEGSGYADEIPLGAIPVKPRMEAEGSGKKTKDISPTLMPIATSSRPPKPSDAVPLYTDPRYKRVPWPGQSDDEDETPTAPRSIDRGRSRPRQTRESPSLQIPGPTSPGMMRIVSKENIRAALGGTSPDNSDEDLVPPSPFASRSRSGSPANKPKLQTYNTHLFPRTPKK